MQVVGERKQRRRRQRSQVTADPKLPERNDVRRLSRGPYHVARGPVESVTPAAGPFHFRAEKNTIYLHPELENRVFWLIRLLPDK